MSDLSDIIGEPEDLSAPAPAAAPEAEAPAPQPEAAPAPAQAEGGEQPGHQKMVPYQALQEERRMRQRERDERLQMEQRVEQRLAALQRNMQPPPPPPPSLEENPVGHLAHRLDQVSQNTQALMQQSAQAQQAAQLAQAEAIITHRVTAAEAAFAQQAPDYQQAVSYLHNLRVKELTAMGTPQEDATVQSARELKELAFHTAVRGGNPAEHAYQWAKARGYSTKPAAPSPADQLQMAQRGVAAATSLGNGAGTSGSLNARELLAMTDDEFEAATKGGKWAKMMGGA